jgi:hypothetical protein
LPKELVTAFRLERQADIVGNLGDIRVAQGKLPEALEDYQGRMKCPASAFTEILRV